MIEEEKVRVIAELFRYYDYLKNRGENDKTLQAVRMCIGIVSTSPKIVP